jgi:hypothetical protein
MVTILILILVGLVVFGPMILADANERNERREMHNDPATHNQWCRQNGVPQKADLPDFQESSDG